MDSLDTGTGVIVMYDMSNGRMAKLRLFGIFGIL